MHEATHMLGQEVHHHVTDMLVDMATMTVDTRMIEMVVLVSQNHLSMMYTALACLTVRNGAPTTKSNKKRSSKNQNEFGNRIPRSRTH